MTRRRGFTLVELLVVITIIGILTAILLPAILSAVEAGRRATCANHLKQLGLGCKQHEAAHGWFPTGGWHQAWAGDPDMGYNRCQPGGWCFNVLPYIGEQAIHDQGLGKRAADKKADLLTVAQTALPIFYCPTRRSAQPYPTPSTMKDPSKNCTFSAGTAVGRTDYAANTGYTGSLDALPKDPKVPTGTKVNWTTATAWNPSLTGNDPALTKVASYNSWPDVSNADFNRFVTGVIFPLSMIGASEIPDGLANTFLLGEKSMDPAKYRDGSEAGDQEEIFAGFKVDWQRYATNAPVRDQKGTAGGNNFGSAHKDGSNFVTCDGAVRWISFLVDPNTFRRMGNRMDGVALAGEKTP